MENEKKSAEEILTEEEAPTVLSGLKGVGFGLIILGLAYYFFITMTAYENGDGVSMNRLLLLAYGLLGKSITTGILSLLGVFMVYSGAQEAITANKAKSS